MEERDTPQQEALNSVLLDAAAHGDTLVVKGLLKAGANIHFGGDEAIRLAALYGHTATVIALLDGGADPNHEVLAGRAWHIAASKGHEDTVRALFTWADRQNGSGRGPAL